MRLPDRDYRQPGAYFITICTKQRAPTFGAVVSGTVHLSPEGEIAQGLWLAIPRHFPNARLDTFVVMPDHVHGIIVINERADVDTVDVDTVDVDSADPDNVGAQHAAPLRGSLGAIVRAFKSAATKRINEIRGTPGKPVWQRNYYDRIVRDDRELHRVRRYILSNPNRCTEARKPL
jgi:putative transposase